MNIITIYIAGYLLILAVTLVIFARGSKREDFLIASRTRPWWQIALSKFAAVVGVATLVTYTGLAYEYGLGTFAIMFGLIAGILLFSLWGIPQLRKLSAGKQFYTVSDFIEFRLGNRSCRLATDLLMVVILSLFLLVAFIGGGHIIAHFNILTYEVAVVMCSLVVMLYVTSSGFKALVITDIIQAFIIGIISLFMAFFMTQDIQVVPAIISAQHSIPIVETIGFLIFGIFSFFALGDRYQLVFSAKNSAQAKKGMLWSLVPIIGIICVLFFIGIIFSGIVPGLDPSVVLLESLTTLLPPGMIPIVVVLFIAGLMSTADTQIFTLASHLSFLRKSAGDPVKRIRAITIVALFLAMFGALIFRNIVDLSILAGALMVSLAIPIMYVISGRTSSKKYFWCLIFGVLGVIIGALIHGLVPHLLVYACLGALVSLLTVS